MKVQIEGTGYWGGASREKGSGLIQESTWELKTLDYLAHDTMSGREAIAQVHEEPTGRQSNCRAPIVCDGYLIFDVPVGSEYASSSLTEIEILWRVLVNSGPNTLMKFRGNFSISYMCPRRKALYVFRSVSCLANVYYVQDGHRVCWSTSPRILSDRAQFQLRPRIDLLPALLANGRYNPVMSCIRGINRIPAGCLLKISDESVLLIRIDDFRQGTMLGDATEAPEALIELLEEGARRQHVRGSRVGVAVSGGLDSSTVLSSIVSSGAEVAPIHITPALEKGMLGTDERYMAECVVRNIGADLIGVRDVPIMTFPWEAETYGDLPIVLPLFHWMYRVVDELKERGIDRLAGGWYGDQLFGNVDLSFLGGIARKGIVNLIGVLRGDMSLLGSGAYVGSLLGTSVGLRLFSPSRSEERTTLIAEADVLLSSRSALTNQARRDFADFGTFCWEDGNRSVVQDHIYRNIKDGIESESEAGLELDCFRRRGVVRHTLFLDRDLVDFSLSIPLSFRGVVHRGQFIDKPLLRLAMSRTLPRNVVTRRWRPNWGSYVERSMLQNRQRISEFLGKKSLLVELGVLEPANTLALLDQDSVYLRMLDFWFTALWLEAWLQNLEHGERR